MKTPIIRAQHVFDAEGHALGRLASQIATILRGKNKVSYQPHIDAGDFVRVTSAAKVKLTGANKLTQKVYYHHSGYPGGLKEKTLADVMKKNPSEALTRAVYNMLPPTRLRKGMMKRLTIEN